MLLFFIAQSDLKIERILENTWIHEVGWHAQ